MNLLAENKMNLLALGTGAIVGIVVGAIALIVILILIWYISTHNKFVHLNAQTEEAFSTIDIYLKKRYDLIPNIVSTVKGYAKHESEVFIQVTEARSKAMSAVTPEEKAEADKEMTMAIRNFNAVVENYPELKANVNFMDLQNQLKAIEGELSQARKYYNGTVKVYNVMLGSFPASIVGRAMKLTKKAFFEVSSPEERQNVKVEF